MSAEGSGRDARIERLVRLLAPDGIDAATVRSLLPSPFDDTRASASAVQQRLWFINQLRTPTAAYHLPVVLRLAGTLDIRALSAALADVATRHEILRTTLVPQGGLAVQQIWPSSPIDLPIVPIHAAGDDSIVAAYRAHAARFTCEPFDLGLPYPWRVALLRAAPADHCLVFVFHHANFDGWSIDVLLADLARAYAAALAGREDAAAPLPIQYAEFAAWQRVREAAGALDEDITYWTRQLAGAPTVLDLGGDRPAGSDPTYRGGVVYRDVDPDLMRRLAVIAADHEATRFTAALAAWAAWLHERTGQPDIVVATVAAGRTRAEFEPLVGAFVNTVAIRLNVGGGDSFGELARQARQVTIAAVRHQHAPLERVLERLRPARQLDGGVAGDVAPGTARIALGQAAFVQPVERKLAPMPGLQITRLLMDAPGAKTDLSLSLDGRGGRWVAALEYSADRFSDTAAGRAADDFIQFFQSVVGSPAAPLARAPILPLTSAQTRVWLDQQRSPGVPLYNVGIAIAMDGALDVHAFDRAFARLVEGTDALRLSLSTISGVPHQRVLDSIHGVTEHVDLTGLSEDARAAWLAREVGRPFNPSGPLFRSVLARTVASCTWLFVQHHLITDGWSVRLLTERLSRLYEAERSGRSDDVIAAWPPFAEYAGAERGADASTGVGWLEQFQNVEPRRFFGVRPQKRGTAITRTRTLMTPEAAARFRVAAGTLPGVAPTQAAFLLCGAALIALLHRMTGETTIALGVPFHRRMRRSQHDIAGLLMDVVPIAVECTGTDTIRDLVSRLGLALWAMLWRRHAPLPASVRERACDVLLNVQTTTLDTFCGMRADIDWIHSGHERESLTVQFHDLGSRGMGFDVDTLDDVFDQHQRAQTVDRLIRVLEQCVDDRDVRVSDLRLLNDRERAGAVAAAVGPVRPEAFARSVVERILAAAARQPAAIAIECGGRQTTYGQLADRVLRIAAGLLSRGMAAGDVVGVCLDRSAEYVEAIIGVLAAGGAYLPLDPGAPRERIDASLSAAGVRLAIAADRSRVSAVSAVAIDDLLRSMPLDAFVPRAADDLAYVIYTSGSTGAPKPVEIPHRALANYVAYAADAFALTPADRALQFASLTFDTAVEEIFPTLAAGATLVLRSDAMLASPQVFMRWLADARITVLNLPTAYWHQLAADADGVPPHVRLTLVGGEAMRPDRVARWRQLAPWSRLLNGYGLTEGTVVTTFADLTSVAPESSPVSIGQPIWNAEAYVLDTSAAIAGDGLAGELYIGGAGLARGYRGDAQLTARRFVPHPFTPGQRLYRTGDRARRRFGGLEYLGRLDEQLKIHGYRVDPEEIAACLRRHPSIADALVAPCGPAEDRRLAAYLVAPDDVALSPAAVRAHVRRELPEYMVPSVLYRAAALPRTSNGKIDRVALESSATMLVDPIGAREPSTVTEHIVATIWSELLGAPAPGIHENFFDLGGHSLVAARLAARLKDAFDVEVPLRAIFERPTIADLAAFVDRAAGRDAARSGADAIPRLDRRRYRAITAAGAMP